MQSSRKPDEGDAGSPSHASPARVKRPWLGWTLGLMVLGLLLGAALGWATRVAVYRSEGILYVSPTLRTPSDPTGSRELPGYQGFLALQVELLASPRLTRLAIEEEAWQPYTEGLSEEATRRFEARRSVERPSGASHVVVRFQDAEPQIAQAGAHALMDAYAALLRDEYLRDDRERIAEARARIKAINSEVHAMRETILDDTAVYGGKAALSLRQEAFLERVFAVEGDLDALAVQVRNLPSGDEEGLRRLEKEIAELRRHRDGLDQDSQRLGRVRDKVHRLEGKIEILEENRDRSELLAELLEAELNDSGSGRITIQERGTLPTGPRQAFPTRRVAMFGLLGSLAGLIVGLLGAWLLARSRRS